MNDSQARKILGDILDQANSEDWVEQYEKLKELDPEIAQIYRNYIYNDFGVTEFYKQCLDHIVVGKSKLGKALK
jgi:ABC-type dipeptide/oligopeptide/nickel transport system permease component